jgi:hypothetical protein
MSLCDKLAGPADAREAFAFPFGERARTRAQPRACASECVTRKWTLAHIMSTPGVGERVGWR